jgi:hypothetical protein
MHQAAIATAAYLTSRCCREAALMNAEYRHHLFRNGKSCKADIAAGGVLVLLVLPMVRFEEF